MEHQQSEGKQKPKPERRPYEPPAVVYEAALEVRAGSPLGIPGLPDWADPPGSEQHSILRAQGGLTGQPRLAGEAFTRGTITAPAGYAADLPPAAWFLC